MTKIALIGNPNSGKTTMFNDLTGSIQRTGNWPGVTVDKKEGKLKGHKDVTVVDLPGIYSLSPYSPEEVVSRDFLVKESPDAIINIVDATNLERNLYLTMQVLDIGIPTIVALNMIDIIEKRGDTIDIEGLKKCLGCEVMTTSALKRRGSKEVAERVLEIAKEGRHVPKAVLSQKFEAAVSDIQNIISGEVDEKALRWYAVKLFERDEEIIEEIGDAAWNVVEPIISNYEKEEDDDGESIVTTERYDFIVKAVRKNLKKSDKEYVSTSDKIDKIVTNRWLALPIFALIMIGIYYMAVYVTGEFLTTWVNDDLIGGFAEGVSEFLTDAGVADWLHALIVDGIIGGVGAVLGFLPQMLVLFILLVILEDIGYMARIAFIMDRVFRRFGLSGKSFVPALIGLGCGVPGIMAARTIESESDRKITAMTTTFMPCSAKLPVIALITAAFLGAWWMAPAAYFLAIGAILASGIILKKFRKFVGKPSPFIMELPAYHAPSAMTVARQAGERTWAFVKKAGTIILLASMIIWFLSSFTWGLEYLDPDYIADSMLADMGGAVAGIFAPLGFGDWELATATLTGLVAKENIVATIAILFNTTEDSLPDILAARIPEVVAISFLVFNLLCAPCIAAMGAMKRELGSWKVTAFGILYQCLFAYAIALIIYQVGRLVYGMSIDVGGFAFMCGVVALLVFLLIRPEDKILEEEAEAVT